MCQHTTRVYVTCLLSMHEVTKYYNRLCPSDIRNRQTPPNARTRMTMSVHTCTFNTLEQDNAAMLAIPDTTIMLHAMMNRGQHRSVHSPACSLQPVCIFFETIHDVLTQRAGNINTWMFESDVIPIQSDLPHDIDRRQIALRCERDNFLEFE